MEKKVKKINYFCISSTNDFKIMDNMHQALINDNFQKALGEFEENAFGNFFQAFFSKIFPIKTNSDLYLQNLYLVERYISLSQIKEIKDIDDNMNYMLNFDFNGEFVLNKEIIDNIGNILLFGFSKLKNKFKLYLIKSNADFKEKLESVKFQQLDLLNEYYNPEFFDKKRKKENKIKKYIYFKEPFVDNDGKVLGKESNLLPNEIILLINKLQYIKTLSLQIKNIFSNIDNNISTNLEMLKYLIILINIQWLLPNILVVNFDISDYNLSNSLIDIKSIKLSQEMKSKNLIEKKTFYSSSQHQLFNMNNFDLLINSSISKKNELLIPLDNIYNIYYNMKKNQKSNNITLEKESNKEINIDSSDEEYQYYNDDNSDNNISNKKIKNNNIIRELYNNYINKYGKKFDIIILTTYFIRILDKLHALTIRCPDIFCSEITQFYKNLKNSKEINFLDLLIDLKQLNILNIEFNSLDCSNFEKILGIINSNINLSSLKLIFFSNEFFYSPGGLYKLINEENAPNSNLDLFDINNDFEKIILNDHFLEKYQKNLEILCNLIRNKCKALNELSLLLNIPTVLLNNDYYILSLIKFITNIFIFLFFDINQIKTFKLIAPLIKLDSRKTKIVNEILGKINSKNIDKISNLFLQLNFYKMNNIINLITTNLSTLNLGNLDFYTFSYFVDKYSSDEFLAESKLVNIKIILDESITEYNNDIKNKYIKLFKSSPKNLINFEMITNIKINYEELCEILHLIKNNYVNKYIITFNKESKNIIDKIIEKELPNIVELNKTNEQNLKILTKILVTKIPNKDEKNRLLRKKIFNNIKTMIFNKKDIKLNIY